MLSYFQARRDEICAFLRELFREKGVEFDRINSLGQDLGERLYRFAIQGKMLRGGLVSLGCALSPGREAAEAGSSERTALTCAGAAMELLQSGLLVHDDIMDRDTTRRGHPTIFYQYAERAERDGARDSRHLGEALGICAGDVCFFLAFELLSRLPVPDPLVRRALALCGRELSRVAVAQMQDVSWGSSTDAPGEEEVLRLYVYKTGRYTFSLPLALGACWAGPIPGRSTSWNGWANAWASCSRSATTSWACSATPGSWESRWVPTCAKARRPCSTVTFAAGPLRRS